MGIINRFWTRLSLSQKIVLPFLAVCLGGFMLGLLVVGYWFTEGWEQNLRREVEIFAERVHQDFQYEQQTLEGQIKLIANLDELEQAVKGGDRVAILQIILPLKASLKFDWIKVVDTQGNILVDVRHDWLNQARLMDTAISNSASAGLGLIDLVGVEMGSRHQVLQVTSYPIKTDRLLGGLIVGRLVNDALLQKIAAGSSKQLLVLIGNEAIASTFLPDNLLTWQPPRPETPTVRMVLGNQQYLAKSFAIAGSSLSFSTVVLSPISSLETAKYMLWLRLGLLFLLGGTIVTIVGILIARAIARPVLKFIRMTEELANGNSTIRVPVKSRDEVGQLGRALNQMAEQLAERGVLDRQVQELQQTLHDLQKNQAKLIQTEKMAALGQLIAGIAHEINTPLGAIQASIGNITSYLEQSLTELPPLLQSLSSDRLTNFFTLLDWAKQPKEMLSLREERQLKRSLKQTFSEQGIQSADALADTLSKMGINNTLDPLLPLLQDPDAPMILETAYHLSAIQNNSQNIRLAVERAARIVYALKTYVRQDVSNVPVSASVAAGIDTVLTLYQNHIKRGIEVTKNYQTVAEILCYPEGLFQVWSNLIGNAIQAMNYQGQLGIDLLEKDGHIMVEIADSGCGIPPEIKKQIFEPFFTTKPEGEGSGLGLSIVSKIVDKHRGKIEVESEPGHTVFRVWLPINLGELEER
ncbi:sensor histidine kinase [Microseira wollei]|uniref:histidine kinase n=1 Tax=Microseira wollei NIES-4236 TaxID=2530354 RepID=A0AAV3XLB7_9CYAN|nr:ATP-binding protein [Microseira wollei]GET40945.1 sensor histidine kinase, putative [Microseira wollei NIES-4236]